MGAPAPLGTAPVREVAGPPPPSRRRDGSGVAPPGGGAAPTSTEREPFDESPPTTAVGTARAWLQAVADRDLERVAGLLAPDVWMRMLLPRDVIEAHDAAGTLAAFHEWFVTPEAIELLDATHHTMAGREHVRYRFRLRPRWARDTWHLIEQAGYLRVAEGRVRRIDLVCTGFHPVA